LLPASARSLRPFGANDRERHADRLTAFEAQAADALARELANGRAFADAAPSRAGF
jgi:hypothetical protein